MAGRPQYLRGGRTRSSAPYSYGHGRLSTKAPPKSNFFAWTVTILIMVALAIFSWIFPAFVFHNPQVPFNYNLLRRLDKLEDVKIFAPSDPPQVVGFHSAASLFDRESGRTEEQFEVINALQKKLYIENYKAGQMLGYVTGDYRIFEIREMGKKDFFPGLALRARSEEFPNVILEYLIPTRKPLMEAYEVGEVLSIKRAGHLAAILHLAHLPGDKLSVSVISLTYPDKPLDEGTVEGGVVLDAEPPERLNLLAAWPVFKGPVHVLPVAAAQ